jgi:hypothetical protein
MVCDTWCLPTCPFLLQISPPYHRLQTYARGCNTDVLMHGRRAKRYSTIVSLHQLAPQVHVSSNTCCARSQMRSAEVGPPQIVGQCCQSNTMTSTLRDGRCFMRLWLPNSTSPSLTAYVSSTSRLMPSSCLISGVSVVTSFFTKSVVAEGERVLEHTCCAGERASSSSQLISATVRLDCGGGEGGPGVGMTWSAQLSPHC